MVLNQNKKPSLMGILQQGYRIYIATQRAIFKQLVISEQLEPYVKFYDCLLEKNKDWYKNNITELNKRIFGPQSMATDLWIDHHFGIACGVTLGFLDSTEQPISMMRFIRRFEENSIHEWTMLVDPQYQHRGLGKATLALGCWLAKNKQRISLTTQLDNSAMALYFSLTNGGGSLWVEGIGFHHTHPNSIMVIADIPENPDVILRKYNMPPIQDGTLIKYQTQLNPGKYLISATDLRAIKKISHGLSQGSKYRVLGWYKDSEELGIKEPLTLLEKVK